MAPPKFADIGKKVRDLFKKNHDYNSSLKVTNKGSPLSMETDISLPVSDGKTKLTYKQDGIEVEANVSGSGKHGLSITGKEIFPGVEMKGDVLKKAVSCTAKLNGLTFSGDTDISLKSPNVGIVVSLVDNLSVGAGYSVDGLSTAFEYTQGDTILNASTNLQTHNLGWYQKCCGNILGVDMTIGEKQSLRVGGETTCDDLTLRGKIDDKGIVGTSLTTVIDPNIKLTMAAQFDIFADDIAPSQVGFGFQVGDY